MRLASGNASLRCQFCNTMMALTPDDAGVQWLEEAPDLQCPTCSVSLWNAVLARVPLHACKNCHGFLVAMNALAPLVDVVCAARPGSETPDPADPADLNRRINCPRCHQRMDSDFYAGGGNAVVSGCERDELNWLDGGALTRIARAPRAGDAEAEY